MRILVVCGAGASSTFVAQRVRHAAHERGLPYTAVAGTVQSLPIDLDAADVVLVGPHLAPEFERIVREAAARGAVAVLLPGDVFADRSGTRALDLVESATARPADTTTAS
jgi:cellobiose PTS system EIIB component